MTDTNFQTMRKAMVASQLRTSAVSDPAVVAAMGTVAREAFVPGEKAALAYVDTPVSLGRGRALNPPTVTGRLLNALGVKSGEKALVVGATTGYSAALLGELGAAVIALEEDAEFAAIARKTLAGHAHVALVSGALAAGWKKGAPYDVILIDGAVEHVPGDLTAQLAEGGRIAAVIIERGVTRLASGRKTGGAVTLTDFADAEAAALPGFSIPKSFVF